jgi:hypothetical protein
MAVAVLERLAIDDRHPARAGKPDDAALLQDGEAAAYRLDREAEIVGDLVARQGQADRAAGAVGEARRHPREERADLLQRGGPAKDEDLLLQPADRLEAQVAEGPRQSGVGVGEHLDTLSRIAGDGGALDDSLDGECVLVPDGDAEKVAGEQEPDDLATSARPHGVATRHPGEQPVPALGRAFVVANFLPTMVSHGRCERRQSVPAVPPAIASKFGFPDSQPVTHLSTPHCGFFWSIAPPASPPPPPPSARYGHHDGARISPSGRARWDGVYAARSLLSTDVWMPTPRA